VCSNDRRRPAGKDACTSNQRQCQYRSVGPSHGPMQVCQRQPFWHIFGVGPTMIVYWVAPNFAKYNNLKITQNADNFYFMRVSAYCSGLLIGLRTGVGYIAINEGRRMWSWWVDPVQILHAMYTRREIYLSLTNHPGQLSLAIPPWVGAMCTGQRAVMLCDWGVKTDMVLFAGNTVWSISERVRSVCVEALYKSTFTLLYTSYTATV